MNKSRLLISAACMAAAAPLFAQTAPEAIPTVEVHRQLTVSAACPDVFTALPEMLGKTAHDVGRSGNVLVRLTLEGERLTALHTRASEWDFREPVRKAVRKLHCKAPDQQAYSVQFRVVFKYDDDPDEPDAMAHIESGTAQSLVGR